MYKRRNYITRVLGTFSFRLSVLCEPGAGVPKQIHRRYASKMSRHSNPHRVLSLSMALLAICTCSPVQFEDPMKGGGEVTVKSASNSTIPANKSWPLFPTAARRRTSRAQRGCGMSTISRTRIVGGRPADPSEWPWMAALLRQNANHYCGGVLITDRHILTAAHCVKGLKNREIIVRLGEYDFTMRSENRALDFRIVDIRIHEEFDPLTYENDIALLKIHRPTPFTDHIWPICLPPIGRTFENKSAIVTGWGYGHYGGQGSNVLIEATIPVWPQSLCASSFTQRIEDTAMCAGAYNGGRDACQGDSGGPLVHQLANGRWVNIGVVSWGIRCGEPGHPGIYTRVSSYLDWIFANAIF